MKQTLRLLVFTVVLARSAMFLTAAAPGAQTKTIEGDQVTVAVTIEAIEAKTRTLTVKDAKGMYELVQVPPEVTRFPELKVGDKITARYYDNVVVRVKKPNEPAVNMDSAAITPGAGARPSATAAVQQTATVTITAIDTKAQSLTVKGENGYLYSRRVKDAKALGQLKVGDRLELTWTEALLISVETPKK